MTTMAMVTTTAVAVMAKGDIVCVCVGGGVYDQTRVPVVLHVERVFRRCNHTTASTYGRREEKETQRRRKKKRK